MLALSGMSAFSGSLMTALGWGSSRQTFRNAANSTLRPRRRCPGTCALDRRMEAVQALDDVAGELPGPRAREGALFGLRVEPVQEVRLVCDEEQHLGRDAVRRAPVAPVLRVDTDFEVDEARSQRGWHAVHDAAVCLPVAARNQRRPLGQLVFADLAVEHQLVERGLDHRDRGRQLFEVDEPGAGIVGRRQEGRRRPARAVGAVAPGDAAKIDGFEQQRPDIDVLAVGGRGDLLGDLAFRGSGWPRPWSAGGPRPGVRAPRRARSGAACSPRKSSREGSWATSVWQEIGAARTLSGPPGRALAGGWPLALHPDGKPRVDWRGVVRQGRGRGCAVGHAAASVSGDRNADTCSVPASLAPLIERKFRYTWMLAIHKRDVGLIHEVRGEEVEKLGRPRDSGLAARHRFGLMQRPNAREFRSAVSRFNKGRNKQVSPLNRFRHGVRPRVGQPGTVGG